MKCILNRQEFQRKSRGNYPGISAGHSDNSGKKFKMKLFPARYQICFIMAYFAASHAAPSLSEGIGLRHLCDWAVFFASCSETEFKNIFQKRLERVGLWQFAKNCQPNCSRGLSVHRIAAGWERIVRWRKRLLMDILSGGNFGSKDHQRIYEGMFISNRGKDGVRHTRIIQFIFTLNQIVYTYWPVIKRWKIFFAFRLAAFGNA